MIPPAPLAMSEKDYQRRITDWATRMGWIFWWQKPARLPNGRVVTAGSGQPGFPDLTLARDGVVLFLEVKAERGYASKDQKVWHAALGPNCYVVRPRDWAMVVELLKRR